MASRRNRRNLQRKRRSTRRSYRKQRGGIVREGRALCIKRLEGMGTPPQNAISKCAKDEKINEYADQWNINNPDDTIYG